MRPTGNALRSLRSCTSNYMKAKQLGCQIAQKASEYKPAWHTKKHGSICQYERGAYLHLEC